MSVNLPNAVSVAVIVGIIALAQGLADTIPALGSPWVPFAVVALGALVKGLQVYLQGRKGGDVSTASRGSQSPIRRVLIG